MGIQPPVVLYRCILPSEAVMAITLLDTRSLTDEVRAALRLRAVAAREAGFTTDTIAAILGVRPESVWFAAYQRGVVARCRPMLRAMSPRFRTNCATATPSPEAACYSLRPAC